MALEGISRCCGVCGGDNIDFGDYLEGPDVDCEGVCFGDAGEDVDQDGICDSIDDCVGQYDECGL